MDIEENKEVFELYMFIKYTSKGTRRCPDVKYISIIILGFKLYSRYGNFF